MSDLQTWPVPTLRELHKARPSLVEIIQWTKDGAPSLFRTTLEGHAYLGDIMRMNALVERARGEGDRPKPRGQWELAEKLAALRTPAPDAVPQPADPGAAVPAAPSVGDHSQVGVASPHGAPAAAESTSPKSAEWTVQ